VSFLSWNECKLVVVECNKGVGCFNCSVTEERIGDSAAEPKRPFTRPPRGTNCFAPSNILLEIGTGYSPNSRIDVLFLIQFAVPAIELKAANHLLSDLDKKALSLF
jgi:hypothetical protein